SASYPLASFATGTKATLLDTGADLTASTSAWDGGVTAWAPSTAYTVGQVRKLASNSGRIFFVTSISGTGTSAVSEPSGVASAVDGGTVTDNAGANQVVWRAAVRFKLTVTLSSPQPGQAGRIYVQPYAAKNGTNT